jgi:hypothetical protein
MGDHRRACAVYAPWRISPRKIRITVRTSTSGRVSASYYVVRFDNSIMSKKQKTDSLASAMTHAFFLLSDIAVEFQSYPSMKWKPAQFELCVVQQVSRVDVDCCLPLRHLVNFTVLLDFIRTASHVCRTTKRRLANPEK